MSTHIVNESARRRKKKVEADFGFEVRDVNRYRLRAATALKAETLLNDAAAKIREALEVAAKESCNGTLRTGDDPLLDENYVKDLQSDLIGVLLQVRDTTQTRVRALRLMEEFGGGIDQ